MRIFSREVIAHKIGLVMRCIEAIDVTLYENNCFRVMRLIEAYCATKEVNMELYVENRAKSRF